MTTLAPRDDRAPWKLLASFAAFALTFWTVQNASHVIPVSAYPAGLAVSSFLALATTGAVVFFGGRLPLDRWGMPATLALFVGLGIAGATNYFFVLEHPLPVFASSAVLAGALSLGILLGHYVFLTPDIVLLLGVLYIVVDPYSVYFGPTAAVVSSEGPWLQLLTVSFPLLGEGRAMPILGAADYVVWAACMVAARRFGFTYLKSFSAIVAGLVLTALVGMTLRREVPALPLMMAAYLLVNREHFDFRQRDLWIVGAVVLMAVLIIATAARWVIG